MPTAMAPIPRQRIGKVGPIRFLTRTRVSDLRLIGDGFEPRDIEMAVVEGPASRSSRG
jgi:hypothetical protein